MGARVLLYAVPGLPLCVEDLMPHHTLAKCAGALRVLGHDAIILDDGTVDALDDTVSDDLREMLGTQLNSPATRPNRWAAIRPSGRRTRRAMFERFITTRVERAVAMAQTDGCPPDITVLFVQRRKDMQLAGPLARTLKAQWPGLRIAISGRMSAQYGREILISHPKFDVAFGDSPAVSLPALVKCLNQPESWPDIPDVVCRTLTGVSKSLAATKLRANATPAYHPNMYPALLDSGKFKLFTLRQCEGLSHAGHYRDERRDGLKVTSARQLRREMVALHELYGARAFHVSGSHTPADSVIDFAKECLSLPFGVSYSRDAHVFGIDPENTSTLSASGCMAMGFSLLTGSQRILTDYFGENWTISDAVSAVRSCRESGVYLHTELIHPVPADDYHSRAETIRLLHRCAPDSIRVASPALLPGSAWHQHAGEFEFSLEQKRFASWVNSDEMHMTDAQESAALPYSFSSRQRSSVSQLTTEFLEELEGFAPPIASGCQAGLIARLSSEPGHEIEFVQRLERSLKTLDMAALRGHVDSFNIRATASIKAIRPRSSARAQKVVGT
jgi:hypothetical protein